MQANHFSFPTDNPVRDERTPCMMDTRIYEPDGAYTLLDGDRALPFEPSVEIGSGHYQFRMVRSELLYLK